VLPHSSPERPKPGWTLRTKRAICSSNW
jgi:hypothetical protein